MSIQLLAVILFVLAMLLVYCLVRIHSLQKDIDFLIQQNHLELMGELKRDLENKKKH